MHLKTRVRNTPNSLCTADISVSVVRRHVSFDIKPLLVTHYVRSITAVCALVRGPPLGFLLCK